MRERKNSKTESQLRRREYDKAYDKQLKFVDPNSEFYNTPVKDWEKYEQFGPKTARYIIYNNKKELVKSRAAIRNKTYRDKHPKAVKKANAECNKRLGRLVFKKDFKSGEYDFKAGTTIPDKFLSTKGGTSHNKHVIINDLIVPAIAWASYLRILKKKGEFIKSSSNQINKKKTRENAKNTATDSKTLTQPKKRKHTADEIYEIDDSESSKEKRRKLTKNIIHKSNSSKNLNAKNTGSSNSTKKRKEEAAISFIENSSQTVVETSANVQLTIISNKIFTGEKKLVYQKPAATNYISVDDDEPIVQVKLFGITHAQHIYFLQKDPNTVVIPNYATYGNKKRDKKHDGTIILSQIKNEDISLRGRDDFFVADMSKQRVDDTDPIFFYAPAQSKLSNRKPKTLFAFIITDKEIDQSKLNIYNLKNHIENLNEAELNQIITEVVTNRNWNNRFSPGQKKNVEGTTNKQKEEDVIKENNLLIDMVISDEENLISSTQDEIIKNPKDEFIKPDPLFYINQTQKVEDTNIKRIIKHGKDNNSSILQELEELLIQDDSISLENEAPTNDSPRNLAKENPQNDAISEDEISEDEISDLKSDESYDGEYNKFGDFTITGKYKKNNLLSKTKGTLFNLERSQKPIERQQTNNMVNLSKNSNK